MKEPKCPECEKLKAVSERSQEIGEFIDWVREQGYQIGQAHTHMAPCFTLGYNKAEFREEHKGKTETGLFSFNNKPVCTPEELQAGRFEDPKCGIREGELFPVEFNIEEQLAKFFEIDLDKVEKERRQLLDWLRFRNAEDLKRSIPDLSTTPA